MIDFEYILNNGVTINSSGTTGTPKTIFRTPTNLKESIKVAIDAQRITRNSKILTVTKMDHAGGLLAQSLPAFSLGCDLKIIKFNPYSFFSIFQDYTHTFLTPAQMKSLLFTKAFSSVSLKNKWILTGSDPVSWEIIEEYVKKGAIVQPNWGMSEIGPIAINIVFDSIEKVNYYKNLNNKNTILGNTFYCYFKIENNILFVKGPTCYIDDWYKTNDCVKFYKDALYFEKRYVDIETLTNIKI